MSLNMLASILPLRVTTFLGDFLVGGSEAETLTIDSSVVGLGGMGGNDTLIGGTGSDLLFGDYFAADLIDGEAPLPYDLTIIGNDLLKGGAGDDILIGGPGNDTLVGGKGNDTYIMVGGGQDRLTEGLTGGVDTIITDAANYRLAQYFENLIFDNETFNLKKNVHGIGNTAANWIDGAGGADTIEGLGGNDTLSGGTGGHDVLTGGAGRDTFAFGTGLQSGWINITGKNSDTITDFNPVLDQFLLITASFNVLPPKVGNDMRAAQFGVIGTALTGKEAVLYDPTTGDLMNKAHQIFAHVAPATALTFHDFDWFVDI